MRVLITGASGFVGQHLISHLVAADASVEIFALDHSATETSLTQVKHLSGDICDKPGLESLVKSVMPDAIVHLAALSSGAASDRDAVFKVNVEGSRVLLDAAASISPFPKVLLASTGYVYGDTDANRPATEQDPIGPLWRYGAYTDSKIEMESAAKGYKGFCMIARPFAHIGPGQRPSFALSSFARQLARIEAGLEPPVLRVGNLSALRDLLDVRDVVRAYSLMLYHASPGETLNIATGAPVSMLSALEKLQALCSVETTTELDPNRLRPSDIQCSTGNSQMLKAATGWVPEYTLDMTLEDILNWWREQTVLESA